MHTAAIQLLRNARAMIFFYLPATLTNSKIRYFTLDTALHMRYNYAKAASSRLLSYIQIIYLQLYYTLFLLSAVH